MCVTAVTHIVEKKRTPLFKDGGQNGRLVDVAVEAEISARRFGRCLEHPDKLSELIRFLSFFGSHFIELRSKREGLPRQHIVLTAKVLPIFLIHLTLL